MMWIKYVALLLGSVQLAHATELSCQDLGIYKATQETFPTVCGVTDVRHCSVPEQHGGGDWATVKAMCEAIGARMCTIDELKNGCASGTGGGYDDEYVWSSSPCTTTTGEAGMDVFQWLSGQGNVKVAIQGKKKKDAVCQKNAQNKYVCLVKRTECRPKATAEAYTRCCADRNPAAATAEGRSAKRCDSPELDFRVWDPDARFANAYMQFTCGGVLSTASGENEQDLWKEQDGETPNLEVCGITRFSDCTKECSTGLTLDLARKACTDADLRLCTKDELLAGVGANAAAAAGCRFDDRNVWSSSNCTLKARPDLGPVGVAAVNYDTQKEDCLRNDKSAEVRCCAELAPTVAPSSSPSGAPSRSPTGAPTGAPTTSRPSASPTAAPSPDAGKADVTQSPTEAVIEDDDDGLGPTEWALIALLTLIFFVLVVLLFVWRHAKKNGVPLRAACLRVVCCRAAGDAEAREVPMVVFSPNPVHAANARDPWREYTSVGGESKREKDLRENNVALQREVTRLKKQKQRTELSGTPPRKPKKKKSMTVQEWRSTLATTPPPDGVLASAAAAGGEIEEDDADADSDATLSDPGAHQGGDGGGGGDDAGGGGGGGGSLALV